ncbi:hypothetical protein EJ04DRAFT_510192 [Polyplosphaeria fusca]|uniref:Sde2 N-terminal ubiquitin domain-containing protein n=1 Tax=Polyplosphaeria fusca TaxID=682080 RepID=A0A9P4R5U9_9PLEO|nr:hypothetical protein EJ04DRAFT_510192 [Polyplosphaeria fusca]
MASATISDSPITVIVDSLRGRNIAFATPKNAPLSSIYETLYDRAPWIHKSSYILTTTSRHKVQHDDTLVSTLLSSPTDTFLPLRLTVPLCGGKGGFGSILRAQGGRMSSRKKRDDADANGSSRNLDGRRLRTVAEAKALAEYLAAKPELEKKEQAEKRKRWEDIVASTERKQEELLNGRGKAQLNAEWVEAKGECESKTREAIEKMMVEMQRNDEEEDEDEESPEPEASAGKSVAQRAMFGWDDDDEFMSDSEEDEVSEEDVKPDIKGKGKAKAV